jgi:glutaredoxin 3
MTDSRTSSPARCERHDLARAPDGGCVRCRHEAEKIASRKVLKRLMAGAGVVVVLLAGYRAAMAFHRLGSERAPVITAATAQASVQDAPPAVAATSSAVSRDVPPTIARSEHVDETAFANGRLGEAPVAASAASKESHDLPPEKARIAEHERAVLDAMQRVDVVVYTTSWCPACKQARSWMNENRIPYSERDVDHDHGAQDVLKRISGGSSIPTFDIEGQVRVGLSPPWINAARRSAAEHRLARSGW